MNKNSFTVNIYSKYILNPRREIGEIVKNQITGVKRRSKGLKQVR